MDIIVRGTLPEEKKYVAICSNCDTKVLYKLKEVKVTNCQREGTIHEYEYPVCRKAVYASPQAMIEPTRSSSYYDDR